MNELVTVLVAAMPFLFCAGWWAGARMQREQHAMEERADLNAARHLGQDEVLRAVREVMRAHHFTVNGSPVTEHRHLSPVLATFLPDPFTYDEEARR